ncbi:MAG: SPFH domain-containing protein [Anaerolineales bacterium]|nr:MAG: SPFH domain-containing protein [Anaerolineales bacterium]
MARIFDIVEYVDESGTELVHRIPKRGSGDFRLGSQVIVRDSQAAVFFRNGRALDVFGPGPHTIATANIPLLVDLIGKAFSGETPFKAEVYFVSLREFTDLKWGTPTPITIPDPILRMARVQARGSYAMQISDPQLFVNKIVGTQGVFKTADIQGFFRSMILTKLTDLIGEMGKSVIELAGMAEELTAGVRAKTAEEFASRGVTLTSVYVEYLGPTEETAKAIDEAASMGAIGDMSAYMQFQAARAMRDAAQQSGGEAGTGVGLGAGIGMGAAMGQMLSQSMQQQPQQPAPAAAAAPATPETAEEIQATLDSLDARLAAGEVTEKTYNKLSKKWEKRLKKLSK